MSLNIINNSVALVTKISLGLIGLSNFALAESCLTSQDSFRKEMSQILSIENSNPSQIKRMYEALQTLKKTSSHTECETPLRRSLADLEESIDSLVLKSPQLQILNVEAGLELSSMNDWKKQLQSGDIILFRYDSAKSAIIANSSAIPGAYSHLGIVAKENNEWVTVEADIDGGVSVKAIDWQDPQFAKALLVRFENSESARFAGQGMLEFVRKKEKELGRHIDYDAKLQTYGLGNNDDNSFYCFEVASFAFQKFAGVDLLQKASPFYLAQTQLSTLFPEPVTHLFNPTDILIDSRFSVQATYRKHSKIAEVRLTSAITGKMLALLETKHFAINADLVTQLIAKMGVTVARDAINRRIGFDINQMPKAKVMKIVEASIVSLFISERLTKLLAADLGELQDPNTAELNERLDKIIADEWTSFHRWEQRQVAGNGHNQVAVPVSIFRYLKRQK